MPRAICIRRGGPARRGNGSFEGKKGRNGAKKRVKSEEKERKNRDVTLCSDRNAWLAVRSIAPWRFPVAPG